VTDEVREAAPAKVNLCLHVTGQRADGYHLLDSLVVFAGVDDIVVARPAPTSTLVIDGPEAAGLSTGEDNLVLRAAKLMGVTAALRLTKSLPIASGIGGGSADAAATLRALAKLTGQPLPDAAATLSLGADVPVCLASRPVRMQGVGEALSPLPPVPRVWLTLVNPRVAVSTPKVFAALSSRTNPPIPDLPPEGWPNAEAFTDWLKTTRNDLAAPAQSLAPVIADALAALTATGCLMSRMSGSGATCFGIYPDGAAARSAAENLRRTHPGWWVAAAPVLR
jgi:4-diphosphocytidyl-2-C-methyl-D-erythritol kinase